VPSASVPEIVMEPRDPSHVPVSGLDSVIGDPSVYVQLESGCWTYDSAGLSVVTVALIAPTCESCRPVTVMVPSNETLLVQVL